VILSAFWNTLIALCLINMEKPDESFSSLSLDQKRVSNKMNASFIGQEKQPIGLGMYRMWGAVAEWLACRLLDL